MRGDGGRTTLRYAIEAHFDAALGVNRDTLITYSGSITAPGCDRSAARSRRVGYGSVGGRTSRRDKWFARYLNRAIDEGGGSAAGEVGVSEFPRGVGARDGLTWRQQKKRRGARVGRSAHMRHVIGAGVTTAARRRLPARGNVIRRKGALPAARTLRHHEVGRRGNS